MKTLSLLISSIITLSVLIASTNNLYAASIYCSHLPSPCEGTEGSDAITASGINDIEFAYEIHALGGADNILVKNIDTTFTTIIRGGPGNDRIAGTSDRNIASLGDEGDDVISISAPGNLLGAGGPGADKISAKSPINLVILLQNLPSNEPDGKKDILDCKGTFNSIAFISREDGDIALHCQQVRTGPAA
ncbi:MAG TPA: hypothetical protein VH415_10665 [Nitrososphaeraceae archaeon]|jgi:hypothetical protein